MILKRALSGVFCRLLLTLVVIFPGIPATAANPAPGTMAAPAPLRTTPIRLKASDLLPANLLKGTNYKVAEIVQNDGIINTYQTESGNGFFFVESTALLRERINDLNALVRIQELESKGVF